MPNETYCNVIGITDGKLRDNVLLKGDAISNPIGEAGEEKAVELYKNYCNTLDYGSDDFDEDDINAMVEDGCLYTDDQRIKVFINWPTPQ